MDPSRLESTKKHPQLMLQKLSLQPKDKPQRTKLSTLSKLAPSTEFNTDVSNPASVDDDADGDDGGDEMMLESVITADQSNTTDHSCLDAQMDNTEGILLSTDHQPIQPTEDIPETTSETDDHGEIQESYSHGISANMDASSETSEDNTEIQERLFLDIASFEGEVVVPSQEKDDKENPFDGSDYV